jgi:hypothetical protein
MTSPVVESLKALRRETAARLQRESPDYRALLTLDEAIRKLERSPPPVVTESSDAVFGDLGKAANIVSQADAAAAVLADRGEPIPVTELVALVRHRGAVVEGQRPHINLSSTLSRDKARFRTVRYHGRPAWWLADRPYPDEIEETRDLVSQQETAGLPSEHDPADLPF